MVTQVSKSTNLLSVSCEIKYAAYIVNSHYISCGEGGNFLSRHHFIPEATSTWRVLINNKNKADHSSTQWAVSPLLFSGRKILLHIVCIFNPPSTNGTFSSSKNIKLSNIFKVFRRFFFKVPKSTKFLFPQKKTVQLHGPRASADRKHHSMTKTGRKCRGKICTLASKLQKHKK